MIPLDRDKIEESLAALAASGKPVLDALIGLGLPAREGTDGCIKILFDASADIAEKINSTHVSAVDYLSNFIIELNQPLFRYCPPFPGEGGMDIFGAELPPAPLLDIKLAAGDNVYFNTSSDTFFAKESGLLKIKDARVSIIKMTDDYARISVDKDMMNAYFSGDWRFLKALKFDENTFNALLEKEGIRGGIITQNILHLLDKIRQGEETDNILVAKGRPAGKGRDGCLKVTVENGAIIDKDDLVATIAQPEPGEDGFTVKGKKLPSMPGRPVMFKTGKNLALARDKTYIYTLTKGRIIVENNSLDLVPYADGRLDISVSTDSLSASITVMKPKGDGKPVTFNEALGELSRWGISYGVDPAALKEAVEAAAEKPQAFAFGMAPVNGTDSEIVFLCSTKKEHLSDGKIDYRNFSSLNIVKQGDTIAEIIPGSKGEDGLNVFGKTLSARPGSGISLIPGKNTTLSTDGLRLTADISGNAIIEKNKFTIVPIIHVDEVNYKTGNIKFDGDVFVKGDVLEGFSIISEGNIFVNGNAYGAVLEAGRNIIVRNIFGKGKALVKAGGDIKATVVENATLEAEGGIILYSNSYQSNLFSKDSITVTGGKGTIIGGLAYSLKAVKAKFLGSEGGAYTKIVLGQDYTIEKKISIIETRINSLKDKLTQKSTKEPDKYTAVMKQITAMENLRALLFEKMQLGKTLCLTGRERVEVSDMIFPDVHIIIGSAHFKVRTKMKTSKAILSLDRQEIVFTSLY